jgi:hypothetical protein
MFQFPSSTRLSEPSDQVVNRSLPPFSNSAKAAPIGLVKTLIKRGQPHAKHFLWRTFVVGPKLLFTSRISGKCAAIMMLMCTPSLLFCSILTFPALMFQSPQQHAYFYFSKVLDQDPSRWIVLLLAGICALLSLAAPARMPTPHISVSYY